MSEVNTDRQFVRIEGFLDQESITRIHEVLGERATRMHVEQLQYRDRDERGMLLEKLPAVGHVVTRKSISQFSKRLPGSETQELTRARTLFDALYRHVRFDHNQTDRPSCGCCLKTGDAFSVGYRYSRTRDGRYIEPQSLIEAYEAEQLRNITSGSRLAKDPITLGEAVCYEILPRYIDALQS